MNNLLAVQVLQAEDDAGKEKSSLLLFKFSPVSKVISKVSTVAIIHNKEKILPVLKWVYDINQEWIF